MTSANHYSKKKKNIDVNKIIFLVSVALMVAILSVLHVIVGYAYTKQETTYMWTGHYYLDFFYYLSFIAQGQRGTLLAFSQFATDDPSKYFQWFPYIAIGQLFRPFHIPATTAYWISVALLTAIIVLLTYTVIEKILKDERLILKVFGLLLVLFMAPFFSIGSNVINYHDFWSSYSTFFRRFEPIPHHLLGTIIILIGLLLLSKLMERLKAYSYKDLVKNTTVIILTMIVGLMFYPFQMIVLTFTILLVGIIKLCHYIAIKDFKSLKKLLFFLMMVGSSTVLGALSIQNMYSSTFLANFKEVETKIYLNLSIRLFILTSGPAILLVPFGIKSFFNRFNHLKFVFMSFFIASYLLFYSPLHQYLGTHNGRFLSPINYIMLGILTILGIKQISAYLKKYSHILEIVICIVLFIAFSFVNIQAFKNIISDKNINSPVSYLPDGVVEAMKYPDTRVEKGNVLMTPSQFLGTILPAFSRRKTYVARHIATPNYLEKNIRASNFYLGAMTEKEAIDFLRQNKLRFVIWTSIEGYDIKSLYQYSFLQEVYKNKDAAVFLVKNE